MKILIYGGGAVGLGMASAFLASGVAVDVLARPETVRALRKRGLKRTGVFGDVYAEPGTFRAAEAIEQFPAPVPSPSPRIDAPWNFLLVCVKSFDTEAVAREIADGLERHPELFADDWRVALCQNGWGSAEIAAEILPRERVFNARVITGFQRPTPDHVEITVHADTARFGSLFGQDATPFAPVCEALSGGGFPAAVTDKVDQYLWAKMLYNCALNPLGAILGVPYGELGEHAESREIMEGIIREIYAVMEAAGHSTLWATAEDYLEVFYRDQLPPTARHDSSTLQDLRAGKRTEIDALNGAVVQIAERHGIDVPNNRIVSQMLRCMETINLAKRSHDLR